MVLKITRLHSGRDGRPEISEDTIRLKSSDNDWNLDYLKFSETVPCKRTFFVELPPGYSTDARIADREQMYVCLKGRCKITVDGQVGQEMGPGSVAHLKRAAISSHGFEVLGDEIAYFMVVQFD